ncbi:hypothetical protein RKE29_02110 [Streptomyces sp. B1866]|uniref:hypothetical protein n=1 Tax=Streptomyces sp. B1866 TaxID=3075431 RepID=UPI002890C209|nr:hypothetical protein [Streptomyces sp. B1866]MDT3395455.1 hypothetical protein [Streptomyces sp. B1866]
MDLQPLATGWRLALLLGLSPLGALAADTTAAALILAAAHQRDWKTAATLTATTAAGALTTARLTH